MSDQRCETCVFFQQDGKHHGYCRRFPPVLPPVTPINSEEVNPNEFPIVNYTDWCGEWSPDKKKISEMQT